MNSQEGGGNGSDVVVPVESIRAISERFTNTAYGFFLGKRMTYPVVANYVRNTWGKFGLVKSMLNSSTRLFSFQFSSTDGLNSMLKNGPWFIRNHPLILHKWNPDVDLMKEDVGNVPVWFKLHGVPITTFSEDGLSAIATNLGTLLVLDSYTSDMCLQSWGMSSYARVIIKLRGVFGHTQEECPKVIGSGVAKNMKKPSQTSRGVLVGPKVGFKPHKEYRPVTNKPSVSYSGNKKKGVEPSNEVSNSNPFEVLNSVDNDVELDLLMDGQAILVDEAGNPLKKVEYPGDYDSEDEIASAHNDMTRSMASERYDEDPYDDDMYEGQDIPQEIQAICNNLDIRVRGLEINYNTMEKLVLALLSAKAGRLGKDTTKHMQIIVITDQPFKATDCSNQIIGRMLKWKFELEGKQVLVEELKEKSINEKEILAVVEEEGNT
ncbi:copia protein [Tanacetum coccineum]